MRLTLALAILWFSATSIPAAEDLESRFQGTVRPFLKTYCLDCHDQNSAEGDLELDADNDLASVVDRFRRWMVVMDRLDSADMPPPDADLQPSVQQRQDVMRWISDVRDVEAKRRRGDPGIVPARRLSNAEYDNTIRDLTGQDLRPASEFPIDPANQEGFDNSGESLTMSPSRLNKYLEAARNVSDHLVLTPSGIDFSPHPVITDTDRLCTCRACKFIEFVQFARTG